MTNVKMSMNPFCEIAVEVGRCAKPTESILQLVDRQCSEEQMVALQEALRLREKKVAEEVLAVSLGPKACQVKSGTCDGFSHACSHAALPNTQL